MWVSLASLTCLHQLCINSSSIPLPHQSPPPLPSVRRLSTRQLTSDSYRGLIGSLPGSENIGYSGLYVGNPDVDIRYVSLGLRLSGASLTEISLNGQDAGQRKVSNASMRTFSDVIRTHCTRLEVIGLYRMTINEESLVELVDTCRAISTIKHLT